MDKKDLRINVTLFSTQEYKMVQALAELHGTSLSLVVARSGSPRGGFLFEDETKAIKRADYYTKKFQHEKGDRKFIVVNVFEGE